MAKPKTIFPSRPTSEDTFEPPTNQEKEMFAEKLVECCESEIDGHEHALVRLVFAVKNIAVTEPRRLELHQHLFMFESVDAQLIMEAETVIGQIDAEMQKEVPPKTLTALATATDVTYLPKATFIQRYMDKKVGKLSATFTEFKTMYEVAAVIEPLPKQL